MLSLQGVDGCGDDAEVADLVALPAALSQLEELTQRHWDIAIPAAFVEALTWEASSVRFVGHAVNEVSPGARPFRSLRVAKLQCDRSTLPVVALAPNLRLLVLSGLGGGYNLQNLVFASPYVRFEIPHANVPTSLLAARALHGSGVFSLCGVLTPDDLFETAGSPELAALPPTLRHAEFADPPNVRPGTAACAQELTRLLTAARDSNLETLTLLHPPDMDVNAVFGGGFHRLRSLTVLGASKAWVDALPVLRAMCRDVVVDCVRHPRIMSARPWYSSS